MITRRDILGSSLAVPALALPASATAANRGTSVLRLVYDARFDAAAAIASQASVRGMQTQALPRDAGEIWQDLLRPQRTGAAQAFAGVTTEQGLFVLRTLATDHRLRVVFTATHAVPKAGVVRHDCEGPAAMLLHCTAGFRQGSWDAAMAASLQHYTAGPSIRARQLTPQGVERQRREVLVSWVIAPVGTGVQGA